MDNGIWFELRFPTDTAVLSIPTSGWTKFPSRPIPAEFSLAIIQEYLHKCNFNNSNPVDSESEDGTGGPVETIEGKKSWRRGRLSYASGHVQNLEDNNNGVCYYLRSEVNASYKDTIHKVSITFNLTSSKVIDASCTCKAAACKSCSHVTGLLFALEDYTTIHGFDITTSTSKLKTWNMGRKRGRYPKDVLEATYPHHSRIEPNRKRYFSMVNTDSVCSSTTEMNFLNKLQRMKQPSMFEFLLNFKYENFKLDRDEEDILKSKVANMVVGLVPLAGGPKNLSMDQNSTGWCLERRIRLTASVAKKFFTAKKYETLVNEHLWKSTDLSNIQAVQYGRDNEKKALKDYIQITKSNVCNAGLVINNNYPGLGCSPDGLVVNTHGMITKLIEIKCPFKLRDIHPNQFDTTLHKNMCYIIENGELKLKRNHDYYFQVQISLAIMNLPSCDFIIWSPKGVMIENIKRDNTFILSLTIKLIKIHATVLLPEFFLMRLPRKLDLLHLV